MNMIQSAKDQIVELTKAAYAAAAAEGLLPEGVETPVAVEIPKDTHTGLPTGQRIHHPLKITKAVDVASPKLYSACCKGEQCEVTLDYYRIKADGMDEKYFTVKLEDAIIVCMEHNTPLTFLPENKPYQDMESVSFTYSKITWTYNDGNVEFVDDWKA